MYRKAHTKRKGHSKILWKTYRLESVTCLNSPTIISVVSITSEPLLNCTGRSLIRPLRMLIRPSRSLKITFPSIFISGDSYLPVLVTSHKLSRISLWLSILTKSMRNRIQKGQNVYKSREAPTKLLLTCKNILLLLHKIHTFISTQDFYCFKIVHMKIVFQLSAMDQNYRMMDN